MMADAALLRHLELAWNMEQSAAHQIRKGLTGRFDQFFWMLHLTNIGIMGSDADARLQKLRRDVGTYRETE